MAASAPSAGTTRTACACAARAGFPVPLTRWSSTPPAHSSGRLPPWRAFSTLTPLGDYEYAIANVHLYDLRSLLESTTVSETPPELKPLQVFDEKAPISGLILSPDGSHLFYLTQLGNGAVVKRIDLSRRQKDKEVIFQGGGSTALAQAPGGGRLYVLAGGRYTNSTRIP